MHNMQGRKTPYRNPKSLGPEHAAESCYFCGSEGTQLANEWVRRGFSTGWKERCCIGEGHAEVTCLHHFVSEFGGYSSWQKLLQWVACIHLKISRRWRDWSISQCMLRESWDWFAQRTGSSGGSYPRVQLLDKRLWRWSQTFLSGHKLKY